MSGRESARTPRWWPGRPRRCTTSVPARCGFGTLLDRPNPRIAPSCTSAVIRSPQTCRPGSPFTTPDRRSKLASKKERASSRCTISRCGQPGALAARTVCGLCRQLRPLGGALAQHPGYQEPKERLAGGDSTKTRSRSGRIRRDVGRLPDGCLLRFTDESLYAGRTIQTGGWAFQLSLPLFQSCSFEPFSANQALIAQPLR